MNIYIPAKALEAGARIIWARREGNVTAEDLARAAFTAMVEAWPGMERHTFSESGSGDEYIPPIDEIFLPLQENPDGE